MSVHARADRLQGGVRLSDGRQLRWDSLGSAQGAPLVLPGGCYFLHDLEALAGRHRRLIAYDLRNRGASDTESESAVRARGIAQDVDDLEELRQALQLPTMDLLTHSYMGHIAAHYAVRQPQRTHRIVLLSPSPPDPGARPPPTPPDTTATRILADLSHWRSTARQQGATDPVEACRSFWRILRPLYVADERHAARIDWGRCELANERAFLQYFTADVAPSMEREPLTAARLATVRSPLLIVHGREDRSAPFAGAQQWQASWPVEAQLLALDRVGHAPWIEAAEPVIPAIERFLGESPPDCTLLPRP